MGWTLHTNPIGPFWKRHRSDANVSGWRRIVQTVLFSGWCLLDTCRVHKDVYIYINFVPLSLDIYIHIYSSRERGIQFIFKLWWPDKQQKWPPGPYCMLTKKHIPSFYIYIKKQKNSPIRIHAIKQMSPGSSHNRALARKLWGRAMTPRWTWRTCFSGLLVQAQPYLIQ